MIRLRPGDADDLDAVVSVFWSCWTISYPRFADEQTLARLDHDQACAMWRSALAAGRGWTTLAVEGWGRSERVVGVLRHELADGELWVHSLYVDPNAQGGGIGGRLLAHARAAGSSLGARIARLWVFADHTDSLGFYRHHGWRPDGRERTQDQFAMPELGLSHELGANPVPSVAERLVGQVDGHTSPSGAAVGVLDPDRWGSEPRFGCAGREGGGRRGLVGEKNSPQVVGLDTRWDVASVTKLVTTTLCLGLSSAGLLEVDKPVDDLMPELAGRGITPALLLSHRSGLLPWQPLYLAVPSPGHTGLGWADPAVAEIAALPHEKPGEFVYSDLGMICLGVLLTRLTGRSLPQLVDEWVNDPLGIDLGYGPVGDPVAESAPDDRVEKAMVASGNPYPIRISGHPPQWATGPLQGIVHDGNARRALGGVSAHAGIFATVGDLVRLGSALASCEHWGRSGQDPPSRSLSLSKGCRGSASESSAGSPVAVEKPVESGLWTESAMRHFLKNGLGMRTRQIRWDGDQTTLLEHPGFTGCALGFLPEHGAAIAMVSNRLVSGETEPAGTVDQPVSTETLWATTVHRIEEAR